MNYNILFSCVSHIGRRRSMNQDNFICNGQYIASEEDSIKFPLEGCMTVHAPLFFGVFDGMGGEECGEIASLIAAQQAAKTVIGKHPTDDFLKYCTEANEKICQYAQDHDIGSMGTTAAMLAFAKSGIVLCNIGDSKIFHFSEGVMEQISLDHVVLSAYGTKPPLSQNLGIPSDELLIEPYIACGKYHPEDIYLICSDGLTDMVKSDEIEEVLADMPFEKVTQTLLDKALVNGGRDNITIIVCKIKRKTGWLKKLLRK